MAHIMMRRAWRIVLALSVFLFATEGAMASRVAVGTMIGTRTHVVFDVEGVDGLLTRRSNLPLVRILPRPTPARLTLMRIGTGMPHGESVGFGDVAFSPSAAAGEDYRPQRIEGFDPSVPVLLTATDSFLPGDVIFFHLRDEGLNHLPDVAEAVTVTLEGVNGDREVFRLRASAPDSPDFYGYALAVDASNAVSGDGRLATAANFPLEATYRDEYDATDVATASALFDPRIRLFDAGTGEPVDGAVLSVFDAATGGRAAVIGLDMISPVTSPVVSGSPLTDAAGRVYTADPGEARIPYLPPGRYRITVAPPPGYVFASDIPDAEIAAPPGQAFRLRPASRGAAFDLPAGGTPRFDIPLDARASLRLIKTAEAPKVSHGDFVEYRLTLENNDDRAATGIEIDDALPFGFRYVPGSMRADGIAVADPSIADDGTGLVHRPGPVPSGGKRDYAYVARVGPQARFGEASSAATARATGGFRSNRAEVMVEVIDDLLSRSGTVLGRVVAGACGTPGEGVGARLLLETGRVIATDDRGRFHGDDIAPGRHALRLDEYALPEGLVPHVCPGDLRPGDTATARTLDIGGGLLREVVFRLRRVESESDAVVARRAGKPDAWTQERLADLPGMLDILYPAEGESLADPSLAIGISYPFGRRVKLVVNGETVSNISAHKTLADRKLGVALRRWHGIDLPDGPTLIEATISDAKGTEIGRMTRIVHYVTEPANAEMLPDLSILVADGQSTPEIAIRVTDAAGRPVHAGHRVPVTVAPPYQTATAFARYTSDPLTARDATQSAVEVGADGVARVRLRPTTRAGTVSLTMELGTRSQDMRAWLAPAPRPWVVVGLAEGTAGYDTISGNMVHAGAAGLEDGGFTDGRLAFYAKGAIRGDWLLTLAYDSDASRDPGTRDFFDEIDPAAYYPVYGDASTQDQAAPTRYPLYLRLERGQFFAMFGDYRTGMDRTELAGYDRTLSGFKTVYEGERFQLLAFAAEADQQFRRVELAADRGIGPYDLGARAILRNSEEVRLVVRGREGLEAVLSERRLRRFVDYALDYETGALELIRAPEPTDAAFNPVFVVADFETTSPDPGQVTAGGRAAVKLLDGAVELGASVIHEEGGGVGAAGDLLAFDARASLGPDIAVIGEVAASRTLDDGTKREGMAYRAEGIYTGKGWRARVHMRQADAAFGVAQQSVATQGRRTYGAEMRAVIDDPLARAGTTAPGRYTLTGRISRDEDLRSGARRDLLEGLATRPVSYGPYGKGTLGLGYRAVSDRLASGETRVAHRVLGKTDVALLDGRVTLGLEREQTVVSSGDRGEPDSTLARIEGRITPRLRAVAGIETFDGEGIGSANLHAGLSADPWTGGRLSLGINGTRTGLGENAERVAATVGVAQDITLTERLSTTLRLDHTQHLGGADSPVVDSLFSQFRPVEAASNASLGVGYAGKGWSASVRVDLRHADSGDSRRLSAGALGEVTEALTLAAAAEFGDRRRTETEGSEATRSGSLTVGAAYRPLAGRLSALHRMDARLDTKSRERLTLVNTLTVQGRPTDWLTLAGTHGIRVQLREIGGRDYDSITQFAGADAYFHFKQAWDFGLHGNALATLDGDAVYGYGASVGYSPRPGMTLRLGYNAAGFRDADFGEANATGQGTYARLTLRFDEKDIRSILPDRGWIGAFGATPDR